MKRVLFICGSINQTTQMHQIARQMPGVDCWFTQYYCDGVLEHVRRAGLLENTILGRKLATRCLAYLRQHGLQVDECGTRGPYDLVVTCSDLIIPANVRNQPLLLVQEGMTDPETLLFSIVRRLKFVPRWAAGTAATGLSGRYDRFCVASQGYRALFVRKGAPAEKITVTGIPNFDDCARYRENSYPHTHFVLVCTSDVRETFGFENRKKFILRAVQIADGRPLIFKLHPNENVARATREIRRYAPDARIVVEGKTEEMIANCDVLITRFSTTVFVGLALGKECYSDFDLARLRRLLPVQNGSAARNIADECLAMMNEFHTPRRQRVPLRRRKLSLKGWRQRTGSPRHHVGAAP